MKTDRIPVSVFNARNHVYLTSGMIFSVSAFVEIGGVLQFDKYQLVC